MSSELPAPPKPPQLQNGRPIRFAFLDNLLGEIGLLVLVICVSPLCSVAHFAADSRASLRHLSSPAGVRGAMRDAINKYDCVFSST